MTFIYILGKFRFQCLRFRFCETRETEIMVKSCVFANCLNNTKSQPELKFYPFVKPNVEPERAKKWLDLVGRPDLTLENISRTSYLCQDHFLPNLFDYDWRTNTLLEPFASGEVNLDIQREKKLEYLKYLVDIFDANTVLKYVGKKLFEAFSMDDIEEEMSRLEFKDSKRAKGI